MAVTFCRAASLFDEARCRSATQSSSPGAAGGIPPRSARWWSGTRTSCSAFVIAWRTLDRLRDSERVGSWVAGIARNLASGASRARAREAKLPPEAAPGNAAVPTPEDAALAREGTELVQRALADLPETHREVLVLHYFQAQSVAAIADGLAISEDLVKQRLSRGRRAVRDHISRLLDDGRLRVRPKAGLVASVVAAITIPTPEAVASTTAGKLLVMTGTKKLAIGGAIALALAGGATWMIDARSSSATPAITATASSREAGSAGSQAGSSRSGLGVRRISPAARAELLAKIRDARSRRPAPPASSTAPPSSTTTPAVAPGQTMDQYVLAAVQEIMPLLKECYLEGLERVPSMAGKIVLDFEIEGEPGIGGLVGESTIASESTITDAAVRECFRETISAIEIDPPDLGVTHQMRTAIELSPDGEPASGIDSSLIRGPDAPRGGAIVTE